MVLTFYSYKGGVGRSMALANVARWFFDQGFNVLMVDWDLEAPGLERFFHELPKEIQRIRSQLGLIDIILSYKQSYSYLLRDSEIFRTLKEAEGNSYELDRNRLMSSLRKNFPPLSQMLIDVYSSEELSQSSGSLKLLSAGWRADKRFTDYALAVQSFDWGGFYESFQGEIFFEWLREEFEKSADIVLIDSRTGVTEVGGVCTRQLADFIVTLCVPNDQSLAGIAGMIRSFLREDVKDAREKYSRSLPKVIVVPSRIENSEDDLKQKFKQEFKKTIEAIPELNLDSESLWGFRIPYVPKYSYSEKLAIGAADGNEELKEAYGKLAAYLGSFVVNDPRWGMRKEPKVKEQINAAIYYARGKSIHRQGIFISYARKDGESTAVGLRQLLTGESFNVFRDRDSLAGGSGWWLQISEALDSVQFMLLVLTPAALISEITRKEWRYARQQGVCVYLVKGTADLEFNTLPRWMSDQQIYDWFDPLEQQKLVNDLKKTPDLKRVPFMADDLPKDFVPRPGEFDQLIGHLLAENREDPVAITAALRGAGGYGKTTLAKAICHDERIQDAFDDGILWVTLGEVPGDLTKRVTDLIQTLSGERPSFTSLDPAVTCFSELLADRDILLVIDDVWNHAHLRPFFQGGERCARLITTRNPKILPDGVAEVPVDAMRESEAVALLSAGLGVGGDGENVRSTGFSRNDSAAKPLPPEGGTTNALRKLAARLGEWPLLLRLANGVLRNRTKSGEALAAAITYANRALDKRGLLAFDASNPLERNQAVTATLAVSLEQLTAEEHERFFELAIFPEGIYVPMATLEQYWRLDDLDTDDLCDRLYECSLLLEFDLGLRVIRLHDVIRTFLRDDRKADLPTLNQRLLDAHRPAAGWGELADAELYFWDHLADHLVEAKCGEELVATVKDWRYLAKKTLLRKSHSVEKDLIKAQAITPADEVLRTLTRSFANSGHLFNHCQTQNDIESTLMARLQHLPELKAAIKELAQIVKAPRVAPVHPLPDLPHPALLRTLEGHSSSVDGCAFSHDSKRIVSASSDCTLKVWDAASGELLRTLEGHSNSVRGCAFSADSKRILSASGDSTLKVWDADSGELLRTLEGHSNSVRGCAFSADSKRIVSASDDSTLKVWDADSGELLRTLEGHSNSVNGCAFSADSKRIVSASDDSTLKVWDATSGELLRTLEGHSSSVWSCAFSHDSKRILSASDDRTLKVWDATSGELLRTLEGHSSSVWSCAFSQDSKRILSASDDRTLNVWDADTGELLRTLEGHSDFVSGCAFSADSKRIVSASWDCTLKVWAADSGELLRTLLGHSSSVRGCAFSPDSDRIVSASDDSTLKVWDVDSGQLLRSLVGHSSFVNSCAFSPDSHRIVSASWDRTLKIWDADSGELLRTLEGHSDPVLSCAFSPDFKRIVSSSSGRRLRVWDADSGELLRTLEGSSHFVSGCAFSADSKHIVSASNDRTLKIWDADSGELLRTLEGHSSSVNGCAFSHDSKRIVSVSTDSTLKLWNADGGQLLRTFEGHSSPVLGCAFSPDSKRIVSASSDRTLKVWDANSGECLATFYADGGLYCCAMHGDLIAAGGARGVYFLKLVR